MTAEIWKAQKNIPFMCFQWLGCLCIDSSTSLYVAFNGFLHTAELRDGSRKCEFVFTNYNGGSEGRYLLLVCEELDMAPVVYFMPLLLFLITTTHLSLNRKYLDYVHFSVH